MNVAHLRAMASLLKQHIDTVKLVTTGLRKFEVLQGSRIEPKVLKFKPSIGRTRCWVVRLGRLMLTCCLIRCTQGDCCTLVLWPPAGGVLSLDNNIGSVDSKLLIPFVFRLVPCPCCRWRVLGSESVGV